MNQVDHFSNSNNLVETDFVFPDRNDSMKHETQVDSSPSTFDLSLSSINTILQNYSIDIHTEHLERSDLLAKLANLVAEYRAVRLTSPSGSGKRSLLKMYQHSLKNTNVIWILCHSDKSCFELLAENGIDLKKSKYEKNLGIGNTIIIFDEAHRKNHELTFWIQLLKVSPMWLPSNIRFIISSKYLLSGEPTGHFSFIYLPNIQRSDFLLSANESKQFLEMPFIGLPKRMQSETLKQVIIRECGGLIGALRVSIDSLQERFDKDVQPSETALLQHFLSNLLVQNLHRCFGNSLFIRIGNNFKTILKKLLVNEKLYQNCLTDEQDHEFYSSLEKAGIS